MLKAKTKRAIWVSIIGFGLIVGVIYYVFPTYSLGEEDYAIGRMRSLVSSEANFAKEHPADGYSCNLADITNDKMIADGKARNGYIFEVTDCRSEIGNRPRTKYRLVASPQHSGLLAFCSNESGVLRADYTGSVSNCIRNGKPL
jgi:hypothetical protein